MRIIQISDYDESSMVLSKPVYDSRRRVLLAAGQRIHSKLLVRLQQMGISVLFVEDAPSRDITMEELIDMPTWVETIAMLETIFDSAEKTSSFPKKNLFTASGNLLQEVLARPVLTTIPSNTLPEELKLPAHSVNVAIVSLQIGKRLGYNELQLRDLAVGCLLHDIGKAVVGECESHPEAGFQVVRKVSEISLMSAHIAYQHHETIDGAGYPRRIGGSAFLEYAQICSLANHYDHFISDEMLPPHLAAEKLMTLANRSFSMPIVQAFIQSVPQYLPGTKVKLSNGEDAIVTRIGESLQRPFVRVLASGEEISLMDHLDLVVSDSL